MNAFCSLLLALVANEGITLSPAPSSKAKFIEWSTRLSIEVNLEEYLGGIDKPLSVMSWKVSERKFEGDVYKLYGKGRPQPTLKHEARARGSPFTCKLAAFSCNGRN